MLFARYLAVRKRTEWICAPLKTEDYVVQPVDFVSPPKWHLGHTTWFFETFVAKPYISDYKEYDPNYNFVFNSYYETLGARVIRTDRGNLSRPSVEDIYTYRKYVDEAMASFLNQGVITDHDLRATIILGLNHEEQHQELLFTDLKYILGHNPLFPSYYQDREKVEIKQPAIPLDPFLTIGEGIYKIGYKDKGFSFDNELGLHKVFLGEYSINRNLVTNGEYLEFIQDGGYQNFRHWHAEGWDWVNTHKTKAPLYWHLIDGKWFNYTLDGLIEINEHEPVNHVNYYEAHAYAEWKGQRLPTEFEWEVAAPDLSFGKRWEWTESAYLPYPGFQRAEGAIGEYNGKFMINQMVLRGSSEVTSPEHSRITYRNFFNAHLNWQYTGIRLAI
ncbi:ergothioneine biosynthesis protein EgtB [Arcticibacter eurypsychrophilus]|uniref:ergothioneine biosynthesis protein EgtB n=1 Tax=Arcticibacter eurypsychrophilus TaxID=1434752 RepID=UPI00084CF4E6|nr:ergothioneine biosynthesis protein EgtB [Arcticibacter eurypsychrophilus]